jgi:hypothetical protein
MLKKLFYVSLFLLISTTFALAQSKTNEQIEAQIKRLNAGKNIELIYNPAGGNSKIFARGEDFGREADKRAQVESFSFGAAFFYAGKALSAAPREINLTFWVVTKKPRFAEAHHLTVFAGGETLDLGEARYVSKPKENMEYLNFIFPREVFAKIAKSPDARMKIGNSEFKFTAEHLKTFDAMAKISDPSVF